MADRIAPEGSRRRIDGASTGPGRPRPLRTAWVPPDATTIQRPPGALDVLADAIRTYRRRWRPLLALSVLTEGIVTLIALPYTVSAGDVAVDAIRGLGATDGAIPSGLLPRIATDPLLAALGGVLSVVPLGGTLILVAAVTALLLAPQREAHTWRGALTRALEHRLPILGPVIALAVFAGLVQLAVVAVAGSVSAAAAASASGQTRDDMLTIGLLLLLMLAPALLIAAIYLAIRWAVAIPVLVMEPATLRRALARSVLLTRRQTLHVGVALLAAYGVTGVVGGIVTLAVFGASAGPGGGSMLALAVPAALHLAVRVVLAPVSAVVPALLYRELRLAADGAAADGRSANAGPDPRRSAGVP